MELPRTSVPVSTCLFGVVGSCSAFAVSRALEMSATNAMFLLLAGCALPMWWLEGRRLPLVTTGGRVERLDWILGAAGVVLLFALSYSVQLRWGGAKGAGVADVELPGMAIVVFMLGLSALDRRRGLEDAVSQLGRAFRARLAFHAAGQVVLGWVVKAFFLPLMLSGCFGWFYMGVHLAPSPMQAAFVAQAMTFLYAMDVSFGSVGYINTSHRIGAQIRSVDSTLLGWVSALACYPPLGVWVLDSWLVYKSAEDWRHWLQSFPGVAAVWGVAIVLCTAVYAWSTIMFGPRFSNLTYRGVITSGPYRYHKHPAYVSKNLSWWLISVPFLSTQGVGVALAHSAALLCINGVYWLRAMTEERHLRAYPEYVAYAEWIARNGLLAKMGRLLAFNRA